MTTASKNDLYSEAVTLRACLCKSIFGDGHTIRPASKNSGPASSPGNAHSTGLLYKPELGLTLAHFPTLPASPLLPSSPSSSGARLLATPWPPPSLHHGGGSTTVRIQQGGALRRGGASHRRIRWGGARRRSGVSEEVWTDNDGVTAWSCC